MSLDLIENNESKKFIKFLFSIKNKNEVDFNRKLNEYLNIQFNSKESEQKLKEALVHLVKSIFFTDSLTNAGINSNMGFFPELKQRIKNRILPPLNQENHFSHFITETFGKRNDYKIFENISSENWNHLFNLFEGEETIRLTLNAQLENALIILAHRFVNIGIDPYLVKKLVYTDDSDSPFFRFNISVNNYLKGIGSIEEVYLQLSKCKEVFVFLKEKREAIGVSLHFTFLLRRAEQHIQRLELLLKIHETKNKDSCKELIKKLIILLIKAELFNSSIRSFLAENTDMVANRIANQTSSKGENYIGFTKSDNRKLLRSAMGGGFIVVILVYIKHFIHELNLPLLPEGVLFGLNYGIGFVAMHLLHFTLATKQPALTASYIAAVIEEKGIHKNSRKSISIILAQIMRSQFISLIGNLIIVLPLCYFVTWFFWKYLDFQFFTQKQATGHLVSNHPFYSGSLIFAAFTGVFLMVAGLITGYYDNKVVFSKIPERISKHPFLKRVVSKSALTKLTEFIRNNLGAVVGNLALGMFLGTAGNIGEFIGLPFDIRHVTISSGNFAISIGQGYNFPLGFVLTVLGGVLLIGIINIITSFLLSFYIACRSRYLSNKQISIVLFSMFGYVIRNPKIFILRKDQLEM